ncbi:hypothetical protein [Yersinia enterocolitica]|uniref:hypothetical protein n=1 Tax=Yersinia enterocolitica TaxID=630 RepID=UPI00155A4443|nr:hypothetical protein [Yersinia enterocolitica]EKN3722727.1 hypothetical protein [Yersinia enterocolitica]EKN3738908.1 hypothetical protein [Yersinia enterocolitica]EKN4116311.1 hypothetical protein [Yersinia enterocolitica]EKN4117515.1 hypothetical protein [Yersinia enterocolitica]EKN4807449.1 hypothetical protein [Yersinia enterocolitica]
MVILTLNQSLPDISAGFFYFSRSLGKHANAWKNVARVLPLRWGVGAVGEAAQHSGGFDPVVIGMIISVATFVVNAYWQHRRTKVLEKSARDEYVIMRGEE